MGVSRCVYVNVHVCVCAHGRDGGVFGLAGDPGVKIPVASSGQ